MTVDLSALVGFGLLFDPDTFEIKPQPGYEFNRSARHFAEVAAVFSERDALPPERVVFYLEHLAVCPAQEDEVLVKKTLAYGFTILPPLRIGREFNKTHGHSHPVVSGYDFSFPEIYAQLSGRMWLLLQKHHADNLAELEDCVLIKMKPGDVAVIPPNYAHMQINPSDKHPSVTAGLYSSRMKPEFDFYKQKQGFAYRLFASGDSYEAQFNPSYLS
ncbi:MAG TPA: glucose-6-phosphate isomerase family protein, partial [Anaerolineales bacterium]|nr:glucose-6-phosphate isomerase family protein [Anaerolineales bacterium]